ncbi:MAG: bifunctional diguanylate cyclase/phosphodiesterase [Paracoccaceae bacterium]
MMRKRGKFRLLDQIARVSETLRRPEFVAFMPAITLAGFWWGGERVLIATALGLPMVYALLGAVRMAPATAVTDGRDGLTGLELRDSFVAMLDASLLRTDGRVTNSACLVLRLDEADRIAERHGHAARNEMLRRTAERLAGALRESDRLARLDGASFAVALAPSRRADLESMVQLSARLQDAVAAPISLDGTRVFVTASVGYALSGRVAARTGALLLEAAETAADDALRNGPGAIRSYAPETHRTQSDRSAFRSVIETALDTGQIVAHFQPQLCTDTGAVSGFEALARWQHPTRGILPPSEFITELEAAGLSERLGEVMLFQALSALSRWDSEGLDVPLVGINFSREELRNPRLVDKLKWELDRFAIVPERIAVEVLETVVADADNDTIVRNIAALAELGCGIDLDDFGTGHASITNIRRFTVRRIKIDRSFVTHVDQDREQQAIVSAILSMAERLGLDTLAEGVETPAEHAMLAQLGCGHVQGFGLARPMPLDDTFDWMRRHGAALAPAPQFGQRMG